MPVTTYPFQEVVHEKKFMKIRDWNVDEDFINADWPTLLKLNSKQVFVSPIIMDTEANKVDAILLAANSIHRRFGASDDLTLVQIGKCVSAVLKKAKKAEAIEVENRAMNHIFETTCMYCKYALLENCHGESIVDMCKTLKNCHGKGS